MPSDCCGLRRSSSRTLNCRSSSANRAAKPSTNFSRPRSAGATGLPKLQPADILEGCAMHLAAIFCDRTGLSHSHISTVLRSANLSLTVIAGSACLLPRLNQKFYARLRKSLGCSRSRAGYISLLAALDIASKFLDDDAARIPSFSATLRASAELGDDCSSCDEDGDATESAFVSPRDLADAQVMMLFSLGFDLHTLLTSAAVERTIGEFEGCAKLLSFIRPSAAPATAAAAAVVALESVAQDGKGPAYGSAVLNAPYAIDEEEEDIIYTHYIDGYSSEEDYDEFDEEDSADLTSECDSASTSGSPKVGSSNETGSGSGSVCKEPSSIQRKRLWSAAASPPAASAVAA
ncbi:hypothetical protein BZA70DRAFT_158966 [Myxozyma melibiosi]|uniref:Cyclin N-terminal domain-containing protein n=1 Tax=Myxozyma melibiosi TaxID=54550 RepID=A0ABR1F6I5_9ASCO